MKFIKQAMLVLAFATLCSGAANAASFYALIYAPGSAWKAGVPMSQQGLGPHLAYMKQLRDAHTLFVAGPLIESDGGLIILKATSLDDAKAIMAKDPAIAAGIFSGTAQSWRAAVDAGSSPAAFLAGP